MKRKRFLSLLLCMALILTLLPVTARAAGTDFTVRQISGTGSYTYNASGVLTFTQPGTYEVSMASGVWFTMTDRIVVNAPASSASAPVCITLNTVNIDLFDDFPAFNIQGTSFVNLTLAGTSALKSEEDWHPGLTLPDGAALTISGEGTLWATGSDSGAGIGGGDGGRGGSITINSGTVIATGGAAFHGFGGAGIGGGRDGNGGTVTITGGTVTADGGAGTTNLGGAGIGGGYRGNGGTVYISGGSVKATGSDGAEAIGKGELGSSSGTLMNKPVGEGGVPVYLTTVRLAGVSAATAINSLTASLGGAPYAYGTNDMFTDEAGCLYLYLPAGTIVSAVETATNLYIGSITTTASPAASGTFDVDLSGEARLSGLTVSPGTLSPTFASGTYAYTVPVANNVSSISMTAAKISPNATMTLQKGGGTAAAWDGAASTQSLDVGANVFTIAVTSQDGTDTRVYSVNVTRAASSDATLSALTVTGATLNESFSPGSYAYTASVDNSVASISLAATRNQANAAMTLQKGSGTAAAWDGAASTQSLDVGANVFTIAVTAQDGTTTRTYTITVTRAASSNTSLSGLVISQGTLSPAFAGGTYAYNASVANSVYGLTVTPTTSDANATVTVNGTSVTSGNASGNIALSVGANIITIDVTAQDGTTTQIYTITVTRAASANAALSALVVSQSTLSPAFAGGTYDYTASVANSVYGLTVTPTMSDANATVTVNGTSVTSGTASGNIALSVGANIITVDVTAQDGTTTQTYTITVTRAASGDTALSGLNISQGTLSPAFAGGTYAYTASVENSVGSLTVTPTASDGNATITVNGTAVASGAASPDIALSVGDNTVTIIVTAQNGDIQTYTVTVTRAASGDAALSGLNISQGTLSPAFAGGTYAYTASVENSVGSLTVTPTASDGNATITVNGTAVASGAASPDIALSVGDNTVTIIVTAQNGDIQTYTLTVTQESGGGGGRGSSTVHYTITATAGEGGSISPSGNVSVAYDNDKAYTITADDGYEIEDVLVDGVSVGAVSTYTFENAKKAHTITASFKKTETDAGSVNPFSDVHEDDWFYENVICAYENGLMTGTGSDMFSPNSTMTRAMIVTVLYRLSGDTGSYSSTFSDVPSGAWYEDAAAWAAANGIAGGVGGNQFAPENAVTREQVAVMLCNYAKYKGLDVSDGDDTNILLYNDAAKISDYAYSALQWACGAEIINGDSSGYLNPQSFATRAEVAAMLQRFIENVIN